MVIVADFMREDSVDRSVWTGDRALGMCAAFCVCMWVGMVQNGPLQQEGVNNAKKVESELKKDKDHMRGSLCKSNTFAFVPCSEQSATSFLPSNFASPHS